MNRPGGFAIPTSSLTTPESILCTQSSSTSPSPIPTPMIMFESREAAGRMSNQAVAGVPDGVMLDGVEVREVVAHA